jgi:hypothetical protein
MVHFNAPYLRDISAIQHSQPLNNRQRQLTLPQTRKFFGL